MACWRSSSSFCLVCVAESSCCCAVLCCADTVASWAWASAREASRLWTAAARATDSLVVCCSCCSSSCFEFSRAAACCLALRRFCSASCLPAAARAAARFWSSACFFSWSSWRLSSPTSCWCSWTLAWSRASSCWLADCLTLAFCSALLSCSLSCFCSCCAARDDRSAARWATAVSLVALSSCCLSVSNSPPCCLAARSSCSSRSTAAVASSSWRSRLELTFSLCSSWVIFASSSLITACALTFSCWACCSAAVSCPGTPVACEIRLGLGSCATSAFFCGASSFSKGASKSVTVAGRLFADTFTSAPASTAIPTNANSSSWVLFAMVAL
mmetsp:Transcript_17225/g.43815  ORF Transcript_17225/g.43815 Transcript_17225/m.43815 type:complete len:329 (-) Transcript_17225:1174-2160(-)